jgi:hypothetical protein
MVPLPAKTPVPTNFGLYMDLAHARSRTIAPEEALFVECLIVAESVERPVRFSDIYGWDNGKFAVPRTHQGLYQ